MIQEQPRLMIVTQGDDYSRNLMNSLKAWYNNYWYVNDLMPKYQFQGKNNKFSLTVGYADDLPMPDPETRDDKTDYEGEYFYHLENQIYLVDNLQDMSNFKDQRHQVFNPRELFDLAQQYGLVVWVADSNEWPTVTPVYVDGSRLITLDGDEYAAQGDDVTILFSVVSIPNTDVCVFISNENIVANECWSTFHWDGVTGKTCLNYFERFQFRFMNPNYIGVDGRAGDVLYVSEEQFQVELFSFYTPIQWMPVCSVYRHLDIIGNQLMDIIDIDTNMDYRIEEYRIIFDTKKIMKNERGWVIISFKLLGLTIEHIIVKTGCKKAIHTPSMFNGIPELDIKDKPPEAYLYGR